MMRPRSPLCRSLLPGSAGALALVGVLLAGPGRPASGGPAVTVTSGSFAGPNPFKADAGFVAEYKDGVARIADGSLASRSLFLPGELSIPDEEPFEDGRSSYHVSVFDGLKAGDIVRTTEVRQSRDSSSDEWVTRSEETQWVEIGPYTHSESQTIANFRDFIQVTAGGDPAETVFRFVKGTGLFWYVEPGDDIIGGELRVIRDFEVIRGGTLFHEGTDGQVGPPITNSRGLTVGTGVTGGAPLLAGSFTGTAVAVPEPSMLGMMSLSVLMIVGVAATRRRRRSGTARAARG